MKATLECDKQSALDLSKIEFRETEALRQQQDDDLKYGEK